MNSAYLSGDEEFKKRATSFFKTFFDAAFKTNFVVQKACLTGTSNVMLSNLSSGFNNYMLVTILDDEYSTHFGFTEEEVITYLDQSKAGDVVTLEELKIRYDGYIFGHKRRIHLFNPVSVVGACSKKELLNFWVDTAPSSLLNGLLRQLNAPWSTLKKLLKGVKGDSPKRLVSQRDLKRVGIENVLLHFGYLKYEKQAPSVVNGKDVDERGVFSIVNGEVRDCFEELIGEWTFESGMETGLNELHRDIRRLDIEGIGSCFDRLVTEASSLRDLKSSTLEEAYHMLCLGLLYSTRHDSMVLSQREAGKVYPDLVVHWPVYEPGREYTRNAVIFEFKVYMKEEGGKGTLQTKMRQKAMEGLEQIGKKNYRRGLPAHVWRVAELGICFSGRESPAYKYREWRRDGRKAEWDFVGGEKPIEESIGEKTG